MERIVWLSFFSFSTFLIFLINVCLMVASNWFLSGLQSFKKKKKEEQKKMGESWKLVIWTYEQWTDDRINQKNCVCLCVEKSANVSVSTNHHQLIMLLVCRFRSLLFPTLPSTDFFLKVYCRKPKRKKESNFFPWVKKKIWRKIKLFRTILPRFFPLFISLRKLGERKKVYSRDETRGFNTTVAT